MDGEGGSEKRGGDKLIRFGLTFMRTAGQFYSGKVLPGQARRRRGGNWCDGGKDAGYEDGDVDFGRVPLKSGLRERRMMMRRRGKGGVG